MSLINLIQRVTSSPRTNGLCVCGRDMDLKGEFRLELLVRSVARTIMGVIITSRLHAIVLEQITIEPNQIK
jgi:hypothetical protein